MSVRLELPPAHVWMRDNDDHRDHALVWRDAVRAYNHNSEDCPAVCGRRLRNGRAEPHHHDWCPDCTAEVAPPKTWLERLMRR